jgi:3-deoxy-7-phosphoheptulonate synthase
VPSTSTLRLDRRVLGAGGRRLQAPALADRLCAVRKRCLGTLGGVTEQLDRTWLDLPAAQQPPWPDRDAVDAVVEQLSTLPPLVFAGECDVLTSRLADVSRGRAFLLQGGDCAETFADATADRIRNRIKTILQMAVVLTYGASMPVIKVGRVAGQFAKPRSSDVETRDGVSLPAYRGDAVNDLAFTPEARTPDPTRLLRVYNTSAATLNLIRAFTHGGFADLRQIHAWNQGFLRDSAAMARYELMARDIDRAVSFMEACGADPEAFRSADLYSSHEALLLDYDGPLTRIDSRTGTPYDVSAHFVWVGERTRQMDGAHVEFLSRIRNPIGVKLGPTTTADDALALIDRLDPDRVPGRLTFITRMGAGRVRDLLPSLVEKVTASGASVVWVCDPMHGNTIEAPSGHKTRRFDDVIDEVRGFFAVHRALGTIPGGVHVELTGDDVTECLGGVGEIGELDLGTRYETACDPRLNHQQSLELSFLVSEMLSAGRD